MKLDSVEQIFQALNSAGVHYLVAGGLAVNAHGYLRFTREQVRIDIEHMRILQDENHG